MGHVFPTLAIVLTGFAGWQRLQKQAILRPTLAFSARTFRGEGADSVQRLSGHCLAGPRWPQIRAAFPPIHRGWRRRGAIELRDLRDRKYEVLRRDQACRPWKITPRFCVFDRGALPPLGEGARSRSPPVMVLAPKKSRP